MTRTGRPPLAPAQQHGCSVRVRLTVRQAQDYRRQATAAGLTLSAWVRRQLARVGNGDG